MERREFLKQGIASLAAPSHAQQRAFSEYCFSISPHFTMRAKRVTMTPKQFMDRNPDALAAINGPQFGGPGGTLETIGLVHYRGNKRDGFIIQNNPQEINGYFTVSGDGKAVRVQRERPQNLGDYWMAIGTFPLLVIQGNVRPKLESLMAKEYRSAIGTRNGKDICFATSNGMLTLQQWAHLLKNEGYSGALNLDGGPMAGLATRDSYGSRPLVRGGHEKNPKSAQPTMLILYAERQ